MKIFSEYSFNYFTRQPISHQLIALNADDFELIKVDLKLDGGFSIARSGEIQTSYVQPVNDKIEFWFCESRDGHMTPFYGNVEREGRIVLYRNVYRIGGQWDLYLNGRRNIVVQHSDSAAIRKYFNQFPDGDAYYLNLSCLMYILCNYKLDDLNSLSSMVDSLAKRLDHPALESM